MQEQSAHAHAMPHEQDESKLATAKPPKKAPTAIASIMIFSFISASKLICIY